MIPFFWHCLQFYNRSIIILSYTFYLTIFSRNRNGMSIYCKFSSQRCIRNQLYTTFHLGHSIRPFHEMITRICLCINHYCRTMRIFSCPLCCSILCFQLYFIDVYCTLCRKIHILKYRKIAFCQCISVRPFHKMIPFFWCCLYLYLCTMLKFSRTFHRTIHSTQLHCMHICQKYGCQSHIAIECNRTCCIGASVRPFREYITKFSLCRNLYFRTSIKISSSCHTTHCCVVAKHGQFIHFYSHRCRRS